MSNERISMNKMRELIRLSEECGLSNRQIARALNISRPVVGQYLTDLKASGLQLDKVATMSDTELLESFDSKRKQESEKYQKLSEKFDYFIKEMNYPAAELRGIKGGQGTRPRSKLRGIPLIKAARGNA